VIIYDWDDTLFCTTFLGQLGFVDIPPEILATLKPLDEAAVRQSLIFSLHNFSLSKFPLLLRKSLFKNFNRQKFW